MATEKVPFERLKNFIPERSFDLVMPLITKHKVHLLIAKERLTKLAIIAMLLITATTVSV